jgi:hypothetical protein
MIQQLLDGLFDGCGVNRTPVKRPRLKKPSNYPEYIQLSLFDLLKPWAESHLSLLYSLYREYIKEMTQLKNPNSPLSKILKEKRLNKLAEFEIKLRLLINEISGFSFMWGLI